MRADLVKCTIFRYQNPTGIQAQALPAALSGRDVLVRPYLNTQSRSSFRLPANKVELDE